MQFNFDSTLTVGAATIDFKHLIANNVRITNFIGNEQKCAQCMRPIHKGDTVLVVQDTVFNVEEESFITLNASLQMVHIGGVYGSTCAEDYLSRMINKYIPQQESIEEGNSKNVVPPDNSVVITTKDINS